MADQRARRIPIRFRILPTRIATAKGTASTTSPHGTPVGLNRPGSLEGTSSRNEKAASHNKTQTMRITNWGMRRVAAGIAIADESHQVRPTYAAHANVAVTNVNTDLHVWSVHPEKNGADRSSNGPRTPNKQMQRIADTLRTGGTSLRMKKPSAGATARSASTPSPVATRGNRRPGTRRQTPPAQHRTRTRGRQPIGDSQRP